MNSVININDKQVEFKTDKDNNVFCTSLDIARVFEKRHSDVLRSIDELLKDLHDEDFRQRNFAVSEEVRKHGIFDKESKIYKLTRDGFSLVAMGFTGKAALQWKVSFISAFNKMESALKQQYNDKQLIENTHKEVYNLNYKSPCRDIILDHIKKTEEARGQKCIKVHSYSVTEILKNGKLITDTQTICDYAPKEQESALSKLRKTRRNR